MNSVPPIDSGDPRLTAYVLGELSPVEAHAVEAWLLKSPEARAEVQGIREMVSLIRGGFAAELETSLAAPVQETPAFTVVRAAETTSKIVPLTETQIQRRRYVAAGLAVAATITLAAIAPNWMAPKSGAGSLAGIDLPPFSGPVPGLSSVEEGVDGIYLASAGGVLPEFRSKSLGNDPIITEVRVLSEDPAVLRNFPLTPEMTTYLPAPRGAAVTPTAGGRAMYLDNERYPNLEIAQPAAGWDDQQIASGLVSPIVPSTLIQENNPTELTDLGRQLFLNGEYQAASVLFETALRALSDAPSDSQQRGKIEALLNASRELTKAEAR